MKREKVKVGKRWATTIGNLFSPVYKQQKDNMKTFQRFGYTLFI